MKSIIVKQFLIFLLMVLIFPHLYAQQEYEVSVTYVNVWVKAVGPDGKPVENLKQEDFQVFENGKPVPITCFEELKITEQVSPAKKEETEDLVVREKFVIYLDLYNTTPREYQAIRPGLKQFAASVGKRNAEIMLAGLMPNRRLGIIAPFTTDQRRIRTLLDQAPANAGRDKVYESREYELERIMEGAGDPIDILRDGYQTARRFARAEQEDSEFTLKALESFANHLSNKEMTGHIIVLYVSGGFTSDPGRQYFDIVDSLAENSVATEDMLQFTMDRQFNFDFKRELQKSIGKLNRLNVTISTIDAQGLGSKAEFRESLQQVADETGGISFTNSQNFGTGLDRILQDFEHQYIICYSPPADSKSGYRKIKVETKVPSVKLRYRQGYSQE